MQNWNILKVVSSACRLTNIETLQNQNLVSALNRAGLRAVTENKQKIFLLVKKYVTIRVEKIFIRKVLVDDNVFDFKNFSYIKVFFNNIILSAEIKATSKVTKNVLVYVPIHLLEILYRKQIQIKKKQSLRYCVRPSRSAVKGIKRSNNNKTLYA